MSVLLRIVNKLDSAVPGGLLYAFAALPYVKCSEVYEIPFVCDGILGEIEDVGDTSRGGHGLVHGVLKVEPHVRRGVFVPVICGVRINNGLISDACATLEAGIVSYNRKVLGVVR